MSNLIKAIFFVCYILVVRVTHSAENRIVVAVIDTGMPPEYLVSNYLCNMPHYDVTGTGIVDRHGHGTNVAGIIAKQLNTKTHCLLIIKWWDTELTMNSAMKQLNAVKGYLAVINEIRPKYINMSLSGNTFISYEFNTLSKLIKAGTIVVVAAGNDGRNLNDKCDVFPACYNMKSSNFHVVGSWNKLLDKVDEFSNTGKVVTNYRPGTYVCGFGVCIRGTSQSTAVLTGELISAKVK
jgi:subtilisin family serine protease